MDTLKKNLVRFDGYVKGNEVSLLRASMLSYDKQLSKLQSDFNVTINNDEVRDLIESILKNLCIPKEKSEEYFESEPQLTIYHLLEELSKEGFSQAHDFLELIDRKTRINNSTYILGGFLSAGFLGFLSYIPSVSNVLLWIQTFIMSPIGLPLISGLFTIAMATYNIYYNIYDRKKTLFNRARDICFIVLQSLVTIVAYGIILASSITITPLVAGIVIAGLFVLSSIINSLRELFCLAQELNRKNIPFFDSLSDEDRDKSCIRHEITYMIHRNAAIINSVSAVTLTGITLASYFIPGSLLITLSVALIFCVVYSFKYLALQYNEEAMGEELQRNLRCAGQKVVGVEMKNIAVLLQESNPSNKKVLEPAIIEQTPKGRGFSLFSNLNHASPVKRNNSQAPGLT